MMLTIKRTLVCAALASSIAILSNVGPVAAADPNANATTVEVTAKRFSFSPDHITVKRGSAVTLKIRSEDVSHGLAIKPLNVTVDTPKGKTSEVAFVPEQLGEFEGQCSHFCGAGHGSMRFVVKVVP